MDDEAKFTFRQCGSAIEVFHGDEPLTASQIGELVQFLNIIGEDVIALVKKMNSITLSWRVAHGSERQEADLSSDGAVSGA